MTLEEAIEILAGCRTCEGGEQIKQVALFLQQQKYIINENKEPNIIPVTKFIHYTPQKQLLHVISEIKEIQEALAKVEYPIMNSNHEKDREHLAEEIIDAITSLTTLFAICEFDEEQYKKSCKQVMKKNMARGYYNVPE